MSKKIIRYYILLVLLSFCFINFAHAGVIINEVKISPIAERFIELYNSGSSSVDLTDWYIQRKTINGSDFTSLITKTYFNGKSIASGGYFLISRSEMSNSDVVFGTLVLAESDTIQIKNASQEVVDKVGWGSSSDCGGICAPNPTEGNSIQKISDGSWIIASPTPRSLNSGSGNEDDDNDPPPDDTTDVNKSSSGQKREKLEPLKISTEIISPKIVTAGIPFSLGAMTTTNRGEKYLIGRFVWNFGDGMVAEKDKAENFDYIYNYSGEYVLSLSYFDNYFNKVADATDKFVIKVIPSDVYISSVGTNIDPYIEIENKSSYDVSLSNWIITAGIHYFVIPEGTTLLSNKKIKLSPKITGFVADDIKYVNIANPGKEIVAVYPTQIQKSNTKKVLSYSSNTDNIQNVSQNISQENILLKDPQVIDLNSLSSNASKSGVNIPNSTYSLIGLIFVICLGGLVFWMIKRNNIKDYVDKEVRAEDITIIE
jgi:hypothetical protein